MTPFNTVAPAADRELGHEIDVLFNVALNPRNSMLVGYSYFATGNYYKETSGGVAGNNGIPELVLQSQMVYEERGDPLDL
jgi:hypothetical protein